MKQAQDESQDFQTPPWFLDLVREVFGEPIGLDPATTADNPTGALSFFTPEQDGLSLPWNGHGPTFVNPPYGRSIGKWTEHMNALGTIGGEQVLGLLPARTDTKWWHRDARTASGMCFLLGRIKFHDPATGLELPGAGKFPSAVLYWGRNQRRFVDVFSPRGMVV